VKTWTEGKRERTGTERQRNKRKKKRSGSGKRALEEERAMKSEADKTCWTERGSKW